jgi:hypothetical protein
MTKFARDDAPVTWRAIEIRAGRVSKMARVGPRHLARQG